MRLVVNATNRRRLRALVLALLIALGSLAASAPTYAKDWIDPGGSRRCSTGPDGPANTMQCGW